MNTPLGSLFESLIGPKVPASELAAGGVRYRLPTP